MTINKYTWVECRNWTERFPPSVFTPNNNILPKVGLVYFLRQTGAGNTKYFFKRRQAINLQAVQEINKGRIKIVYFMWIQNYKRSHSISKQNLDSHYNAPGSTFCLDPFPVNYLNQQQ
jgi:hypothetical protein